MKITGKTISHLITKTLLATLSLCLPALTHAETSVATVPEGYVTLTALAGTGTSPTLTILSLPLLATATIPGQITGVITGVTSNTISNTNAGWTAGTLSTAATPYLIRVTSGAAQGRTFLISASTANTSTSVTLDTAETTDLTSLGIAAGTDTYEVLPCDTIASVFGTPATSGVLGGTAPAQSDQVMLLIGGIWKKYYYSTSLAGWRQSAGNAPANDIPIAPHSAIVYIRLANTPISFTVTGRVPNMKRIVSISNTGLSLISNGWPTGVTLANSGINQINGWLSNSTAGNADQIQILVNGIWKRYYHDGSMWRAAAGNAPSDSIEIPAGGGMVVIKKNATAGSATLTQTLPYSL